MIRKGKYVYYDPKGNSIKIVTKVNSYLLPQFSAALNVWRATKRRYEVLTIDFSGVTQAYSNGMLAIIAIVQKLKIDGYHIRVRLPDDQKAAQLFIKTNWAYFLDPKFGRSKLMNDRHIHTRQFWDDKDIADLTNDFMDVVLCTMRKLPKDIISALEWSIYEICDNVINHSESKVGGYIEAVTFSTEQKISFTVADAGRGILHSLKEGIPGLTTSVQAIGEAMKAGVTRNKAVGQGNGLAGSLRITTMSGGSIDITSGAGRIYCTSTHSNEVESAANCFLGGTSVSGQINMTNAFSIGKALQFEGVEYVPLNIIDLVYESPDEDMLILCMSKETTGVGTRKAGRQLRNKTLNLINNRPGFPLAIDWEGIPVVSSSFADEFVGMLYLELGKEQFDAIVRNQNMEGLVRQLIEKAITQRLAQEGKG